jgi:hypothetical protein
MRNPINVPPRMDAVIDHDKAAGFLKNPPSLEPRPNFTNIRALQKHIVQALAQLLCPQSAIHGWSGLAMDPATYLLLEGAAFTIPPNPGPMAIFLGGAAVARTVMKTTQAAFDRAKKLLLILQEHNKSVLPHAQRKCVGTIQGVKQPGANGVELNDVNH